MRYEVNTWQYDSKDEDNPVKVYHQVYLPDYDANLNVSSDVDEDYLFDAVLHFLDEETDAWETYIEASRITDEIMIDREVLDKYGALRTDW